MTPVTVTIIIPTHNRPLKTARAVASALYQTWTDRQVVVVDDGSTDQTRDHLARFGDRVQLLHHPANRGVSAARNTGIRATSSPFIAFLDSDDYWLPEKLTVQMNYFKAHPETMICQTDEFWVRHGRPVNPKKEHLKPSGEIFSFCLKRCMVSPSAVVLKRTLLEQVGWFDEDLPACEDYDLWLRIASRFPVPLIAQKLLVKEGGHEDQLSLRYKGMDRFRIYALVKAIQSGNLAQDQRRAAWEELAWKCRIYGMGCLKRGKREESNQYLTLLERLMGEGETIPIQGLLRGFRLPKGP